MKLWASASAIGLSMASLLAACSSTPSDSNTYHPGGAGGAAPGGAPGAGAPAGGSVAGAGAPGAGTTSGGNTSAGAGGVAAVAGAAGASTAGAGGAATGGTGSGSCPAGVTGHCDANAVYPTYADYSLNLVEDFPAPLDLNADPVWTWSDGIPNDSQTGFAETQITFANGRMILTAISKCPAALNGTCYPPRSSYAEAYTDEPIPRSRPATGVISGELRTKYNNYRYGRYEVKMKAPNQPTGNFLSTMFVFRNPTNVAWNEIDIELEAFHQGQVNGNAVNAPNGAKGYPGGAAWSQAVPSLDIATDHIYAFTWTPTAITWYVDNMMAATHSYTGTAPPIPTLSAKIMMNLWVFHNADAFGDPTKNTYPMTSEYDYFHYYKWSGETVYPIAGHPTGADYTKAAQNNPKEMNYGM